MTAAIEEKKIWRKAIGGKFKYEISDKNGLFIFETHLTKKVIAWAVAERKRLLKCFRCRSVCSDVTFTSRGSWKENFCSAICAAQDQAEAFSFVDHFNDNEESEFEI